MASRRSAGHLAEEPGLLELAPPETTERALGVDGHRRRLRERFLAAGPEALADHEMLEIVLFALPRRDTKPLARALLTRFGSASSLRRPRS